MGKWSRHRLPRRFYRQEKLPSPTPLPFHPQPPPPSGSQQDGVPYWEKQYCTLIGCIPWWKVGEAKNYIYGNSMVVNWDDSAGEEAFQNAKQRFWADINGFTCDISLPDPDLHIDEIDWSPIIDPELIKEVDCEYFAPDEGEGESEFGQRHKKTKCSDFVPSDANNRVPDDRPNPWECDNVQSSGDLKSTNEDRNQWGTNCYSNLTDLVNTENPWECGTTRGKETMEKSAWEDSRGNSWGWNQKEDDFSLIKVWDESGNPREHGCLGVSSVKGNGWGEPAYNNRQESKNVDHVEYPWECDVRQNNRALKDRGWTDCGRDKWRWNQWDSHNDKKNNLDLRITNTGRGARNEGGQNRDCPRQYTSGYKSSRFQGSDYQAGNCWSRGNNRKRVSSGFE